MRNARPGTAAPSPAAEAPAAPFPATGTELSMWGAPR